MDYQTIERVKKGIKDSAVGPETIALMLTGGCNFNCIYCRGSRPQKDSSADGELSTRELFGLFDDARAFGVKEINLGGMNGEPFCRKDIIQIVKRIKELHLFGSMTTNGGLLNAQAARELDDCGWDILLLSLDSPEPSVQYALRPAFSKAAYFDNITEFLETLKSRKSKLRVLLNMVITRMNYKLLPRMLAFVQRYDNIESINLLKLINMGLPTYGELALREEELREFRSMLAELKEAKKINYAANWGVDPDSRERPQDNQKKPAPSPARINTGRCFTNYYILSIDANGDLLQCPQHQKTVQGLNVKNTPLRKLWKEEHLKFRKTLADYAPCFDECCTILKEQNELIARSLSRGD